ncbi:MAG: formylmethanofuran dehydrogenase [Firmicutes bacterium]|jgi:formylmethanofuran dehydrogenase subunit E|nr:formylmethanofuran dehydrogenase [Bacillota bacterium]
MAYDRALWEKAVAFHGHECIGLAWGFKVAEAALKNLEADRDIDEEILAIVENDSCAVDAIQFITGCTLGKGNLIFHDFGKPVYTFVLRKSGKAIRIIFDDQQEEEDEEMDLLRKKVFGGEANEKEKKLFRDKTKEKQERILSCPVSEVCRVEELKDFNPPEKARIFSSVICSQCGEKVMEPRARIKDGKPACIPCSDKYSRGWMA